MKCKNCENEVDKDKIGKYASGNFCSLKCAHSWSTKNDNKNQKKIAVCGGCGKEIEINKRASIKNCKCNNCKNICKYCGQTKPCKRPDICKKYKLFPSLIKYFGFNESKIGTIDIYEEFERVKNLLIEDYLDNELSLLEIKKKYNICQNSTTASILHSFDIQIRNNHESGLLAWKNNKSNGNTKTLWSKFKTGWHKTWNNKKVFYRSSYELDYAKQLDKKQIDYEMESLRISYWDSQKLIQRTAIPDFYLPKNNTIIEIKSNYTYNEQNIKDKFKSYKKHGYNCKLILEKKMS